MVDTPPVSPGDPDSIARLEELLAATRPDEVHLTVPAATDVRAVRALLDALSGRIAVGRLLITRLDEMPSAAVAVGLSLTLRKPISYVSSGRDPRRGLRPADPAELAAMVMV